MKEKLLNKKTITALMGLIVAIGASFGVDIDPDIQTTIIEIAWGFAGGGTAGYQIAKKVISKKVNERVAKFEIESQLAKDSLKSIGANLMVEYGDDAAMFVKGEVDAATKSIDAMIGGEWKF